jgi:hypothetical protein
MGIDVQIYATGALTDEELSAAERYLTSRLGDAPEYLGGRWLSRDDEEGRVDFGGYGRLYHVGYERGDWPKIYGWIRLMQAAFPQAQVCYGGDTDFECPTVDDDELTRIWDHYLGPHGDDYRERARRRNEESARPEQGVG